MRHCDNCCAPGVEHGYVYRTEQGRLKIVPSIIKKKMSLKIIEV